MYTQTANTLSSPAIRTGTWLPVALLGRVAFANLAAIHRRRVVASSGLSPALTDFGAGAERRPSAVHCNVADDLVSKCGLEFSLCRHGVTRTRTQTYKYTCRTIFTQKDILTWRGRIGPRLLGFRDMGPRLFGVSQHRGR